MRCWGVKAFLFKATFDGADSRVIINVTDDFLLEKLANICYYVSISGM